MITPIDIETVEFKKVALGYAPDAVDEFLNRVIEDFERLYKENASLKDRLKNADESIKHYKSMEETIKSSIVLAEKSANAAKRSAAEQAANIIQAAQNKADEKLIAAEGEKAKLEGAIGELKGRYLLMASSIRGLIETELKYIDRNKDFLDKLADDPTPDPEGETEEITEE